MSVTITKTIRCARQAPTRNSTPTTTLFPAQTTKRKSPRPNFRSPAPGFTLVEILIVLAIVAMILAMGIPAIKQIVSQRLNSTTREFVGRIRSIRNDSILLSNIYRLAFDLDEQKFWVESQRRFELLSFQEEDQNEEEDGEKQASNFEFAEKYSNKPRAMPSGIVMGAVYTERGGWQTEGVVYMHFFPNGYNEPATLYLARDGSPEVGFAMEVRPTGGTVDIYPEEYESLGIR